MAEDKLFCKITDEKKLTCTIKKDFNLSGDASYYIEVTAVLKSK